MITETISLIIDEVSATSEYVLMIESGPNTMVSSWEYFNQAVRDSNLAREKFSLDAIPHRFTSSWVEKSTKRVMIRRDRKLTRARDDTRL